MMRAATLTLNPCLDKTMYFDRSFRAGELNRCTDSIITLGSKGVNVSRFLGLFGIEATAFGFCGGDTGEQMKKMLDCEGVSYNFTNTEAPTRMNIKLIDSDGVCTEANEKGGPIKEEELDRLITDVEKFVTGGEYFFLGGSVPYPIEKSVYKLLITKLKNKGARVISDCDGQALKSSLEAKPYMIKPNLFELSGLCGAEIKTTEEACEWTKRIYKQTGVEILCTLSEKGAIYCGEKGVYSVNSPQVTLRGFTGAGDSFLASFVYMLDKTDDVEESLRFASSAAAAKVEMPGSLLPKKEDTFKYKDSLTVIRR